MHNNELEPRRGRVNRRIVKTRMNRTPQIIHPFYGTAAGPAAHAKVYAPDGFGCDVEIVAECNGGPYGGNDDPQLAVRMKFTQQHAAEVHDCGGRPLIEDLCRTYPPTVTLHAWGSEASELPNILRRAADAAEVALELNIDRAKQSAA